MEEQNIFTVDEKGNITFTEGGRERTLTAEGIETLKRQAGEKLRVSEAVARARQMVAEAVTEDERKAAELQLTNAEAERDRMREGWKKEIDALEKPHMDMANHIDNPILSAFTAFFESYSKQSRKVQMILSHESVMQLDTYARKAEEGLDAFRSFLEERGEQWEMKETASEAKDRAGSMYIIVATREDGSDDLIAVPAERIEERLGDERFLSRLGASTRITTYQALQADYIENTDAIFSSQDKRRAVEKLGSAIRLSEASGDEAMAAGLSEESARKVIGDYNKTQREHLRRFYDKAVHRIDPDEVDFTPLGVMGVDVRRLSEAECRSLLSGNLSPLLDGVRVKGDSHEAVKLKFRLSKDNRGKCSVVTQLRLREAVIPQAVLGVRLSEEQRGQLRKYGMLVKTLEARVDGLLQNVMPYVDRDTNQILLRNYNKLTIPERIEGRDITEDEKKRLLKGETVKMENLTDNAGQRYVGYVRVNPMTGLTESMSVADLRYQYQVAANNRGARTEELKQDKSTSLDSGQTRNNDPKEEPSARHKPPRAGHRM